MTDTELKLVLAKMLPEVVRLVCSNDRYHWTHPPYETVRDTELLHLVSLVEAKLTQSQEMEYSMKLLNQDCRRGYSIFATWQQRTIALCKTKGIEV